MSYLKRRIVTTLPTTLRDGEEVYYQDSNGVRTLWVGNAQGEAWPAVGYKEWIGLVSQDGTSAPTAIVKKNEIGAVSFHYDDVGAYAISHPSLCSPYPRSQEYVIISPESADDSRCAIALVVDGITLINTFEANVPTNGILSGFQITLRLYP